MQYDLVIPEDPGEILDVKCLVVAAFYDENERRSFGIAEDIIDAFPDDNELNVFFNMLKSPLIISDFYDENRSLLQEDYWKDVSEYEFLNSTLVSGKEIVEWFLPAITDESWYDDMKPLSREDEEQRPDSSIRVKIKKGVIKNRYPFRIYAIEVEYKRCYIITGGTIKIHKDMRKADNTEIELKKLNYTLQQLQTDGIDTREGLENQLI